MNDKWEMYGKIRAMHVNGLSDRKIAKALGVGRRTVRKYRDGAVTPDKKTPVIRKAPLRDAAESEIARMLSENALLPKKQRLSAKDMWKVLVSEHGIAISEPHVRRLVREIRDAHADEFIPLAHEPGECAQIDWLENVTAIIGGVKQLVQVFVCALPYSGAVCAFIYPDRTMLSFLDGHVKALSWLGGTPKRLTFDNLRTAVLSGYGKNAVTQEEFKRLERHYAFTAEFCNREAGWEKSNAENGVKITRNHAFVPIPRADSFEELQNHVSAALLTYNMTHRIQGRVQKIWNMFQQERTCLAPLPLSPFEADETVQTKVGSDQTVRYMKVRYSVPHGLAGRNVTLRISPFGLKVYFRGELVCTHKRVRPGGPDQYVFDHYLEALSRKPRATSQALPVTKGVMPAQCRTFLELCSDQDAEKQLVDVMLLARDMEPQQLLAALDEAIATGRPTAELVRFYLYGQQMPEDAFVIRHNDLADYDRLIREQEETDAK